jgi:hypothetical protein
MKTKVRRPDGERSRDVFDILLALAHRLLNPPTAAPQTARSGRPRRVRDRVPL